MALIGDVEMKFAFVDEAELIVRMAEAFCETKRPPGASANDALEAMDPPVAEAWLRAALAVRTYLLEISEAEMEPRSGRLN